MILTANGRWSSQFSLYKLADNRFCCGPFWPFYPESNSSTQGHANPQTAHTLVIIPHQRLGSWGGRIGGSANIHPAVSDVTASVYVTASCACFTLTPDNMPSTTAAPLVPSSLIWPRHPGASGLASDGWVITIITQEALQGAAAWQRPPVFNRIFGCFIGFNSALQGRWEGARMIRKPLMWEMKSRVLQTEPRAGWNILLMQQWPVHIRHISSTTRSKYAHIFSGDKMDLAGTKNPVWESNHKYSTKYLEILTQHCKLCKIF